MWWEGLKAGLLIGGCIGAVAGIGGLIIILLWLASRLEVGGNGNDSERRDGGRLWIP